LQNPQEELGERRGRKFAPFLFQRKENLPEKFVAEIFSLSGIRPHICLSASSSMRAKRPGGQTGVGSSDFHEKAVKVKFVGTWFF
jgi:hypothetical protein